MHCNNKKKALRRGIGRSAFAFFLVLVLSISSLATVMANTVSATVIDGENTYTISMDSDEISDIIMEAEAMGLAPLGPLDIYERVGNTTTINIRRGITMTLVDALGETQLVVYKGDTVKKALEDNNVLIKDSDLVEPERDTVITEDLSVKLSRVNTVSIEADDKTHNIKMTDGTVAMAIEAAGVLIGEQDSVNYRDDELLFDGMCIKVSRIRNISITADGQTVKHSLSAKSVAEALEKANISYDGDDIISPRLTSKISEGMEIVLKRIEISEELQTEEIAFETIVEETDSLYIGESRVTSGGVKGEKQVSYKITLTDKVETAREAIKEEIIKEPVAETKQLGTKEKPAPVVNTPSSPQSNRDGLNYSSIVTGLATAYCDTGLTASGHVAGYDYVAVNPNIIPLGSSLYIRTTDGAYERYCIASDTGGNLINGNVLIDFWFPTAAECYAFGARNVEVYILN